MLNIRKKLRHTLLCGSIGLLLTAVPLASQAQNYPNRPITVVTFVPNGSAPDAIFRAVAVELGKDLGQEVVVENRPGGGGTVSARHVRNSKPDGYTVLLNGSSRLLSALARGESEDAFAGLTPVSSMIAVPMAFAVRSDLEVENLDDFVQLARKNPKEISYASTGIGSIAHVYGELMSRNADIEILHAPYNQTANSYTDLIGKRIHSIFSTVGTLRPFVEAGQVKLLGVTGETRTSAVPEVPTFEEQGYKGMDVIAWNGVFVPEGTSAEIIDRLGQALQKAAKNPSIRELANGFGMEMTGSSPEEFGESLDKERDYWAKVIQETGIKIE